MHLSVIRLKKRLYKGVSMLLAIRNILLESCHHCVIESLGLAVGLRKISVGVGAQHCEELSHEFQARLC